MSHQPGISAATVSSRSDSRPFDSSGRALRRHAAPMRLGLGCGASIARAMSGCSPTNPADHVVPGRVRTMHLALLGCLLAAISGALGVSSAKAQFQCASTATSTDCTNPGVMPANLYFADFVGNGTASFSNFGTISAGALTRSFVNGNGASSFANFGTISNTTASFSQVSGNGTASFTNFGTIANASGNIAVVGGSGIATLVNVGILGSSSNNQATVNGDGNASIINSGTIGSASTVQLIVGGNGKASFTNTGSVGPGSQISVEVSGNGIAAINNYGALNGTLMLYGSEKSVLTSYAGSRIIGQIQFFNLPNNALEFVGGNYLYTITSPTAVTVNSHGAPFVLSGNTVAVLDPTVLALEDRSVANFAGGVSSLLQDRFQGFGSSSGSGPARPLGFAAEAPARVGAAHDAFAGLPSLSMSYSSEGDLKAGDRIRGALASYTKAPPAPVNDITVWTSGFGGERRQAAYDPVLKSRDTAFGGAIGIDRQLTPSLRLGVFAGAGSSRLRTEFDVQSVDSDYGFGGGYGRYDNHNYYFDFALFGGGISSNSTRQVVNNLVANGLEVAKASYGGWFISPDVTFGYRFFNPLGTITPKVRVRYVAGALDGYTETGSAQGLTIGRRTISDVEERLGVEFAHTVPVAIGGTLRSSLEVSGVGLQRTGDNTINAVLLAQNIAFTTPGRSQALGGAVGAGLDWRPKDAVSVYVSAEGTAMDDKSDSYVAKGGVRVGF